MKRNSSPDFEILEFSDSRYQALTVEIQYKGEPVAQINKDSGLANLELEIFGDIASATLKIPLQGFLDSLILAKKIIDS